MFRRILFWMHLAIGVTAGIVILIMSATGVLLSYERQIVAWADRNACPVSDPAADRMGIESTLGRLRDAKAADPTSATIRADGAEPTTVTFGRENVLVDPATGLVLGPQTPGVRAFFRFVTDWHRWLGSTGRNRSAARTVTGASNLVFLFLVVSGLYLWLPRKWRWTNLRAMLLFRGGLSGKARDFHWHNVVGFWCCIPLFFIVLSGVVISYPWASDWVYRVNGVQAPNRAKAKGRIGTPAGPSFENLNFLLAEVQAQAGEWRSISFQVPGSHDSSVTFNIDAGNGGQPQKRSTVTLDRTTGAVLRSTAFADQDAGQRARSWMRFVHTGEYYGWVGQTIAGMASAGAVLLVWTGFALALRRFRSWSSKR